MATPGGKFNTMDEYIDALPEAVRERLQTIRRVIKAEVPEAVEAISYQMPTFKLNGKNLIHFAAWKTHISLYPTPPGTEAFQQELSAYKREKGTIQFPYDKPLPVSLIRQIVAFRVQEVLGR